MNRYVVAALTVLVSGLGITSNAWGFAWPSAPEQIAQSLAAEDVGERRAAAAKLRELPSGIAAKLVLEALQDSDLEVRLVAGRAAIELRIAGAGERVVGWLGEPDVRLRLAACEILRVAPTAQALVPLARALGDANPEVRVAAATTLGLSGSAEAVASLLGHLDDSSADVRAAVILALGRLGDARAVVPLLGKVQDGSIDVRRVTVRVLGDLADPRAASALMLALRDSAMAVRIEAIDSLGRLGAAEATSAIAPLAGDVSSPRIRSAAIGALGHIGGQAAVEALVAALENDDPASETSDVRDALVQVGAPAIPRLMAVIESGGTPSVSAGACLVLAELKYPQAARTIIGAVQRGQVPALVGLRALSQTQDRAALSFVLELLAAPSESVRRAAMEAATLLLDPAAPDGRVVDPVLAQVSNSRLSPDERVRLIELLGMTGAARAVPMLVSLGHSSDLSVRQAALTALGRVAPAGQDAILLEGLGDAEPSIRWTAAQSLAKEATPASAAQLLYRFVVASEQDRIAVGIALSGAMSRVQDTKLIERVGAVVPTLRADSKDVLIEGLGRAQGARATQILVELARSGASSEDRRKVAEALGTKAEALGAVRWLAKDPDPAVQANAVWALGAIGGEQDVTLLVQLVKARDDAVAANALGALGRISKRLALKRPQPMCDALDDARPYVRTNALAALRLSQSRCGDGARERRVLGSDESPVVRAQAAQLLQSVSASDAAADQRALRRCVFEDRNGSVAVACRGSKGQRTTQGKAEGESVLVFVVPDGRATPTGRAPFALVLADGLMRLGLSDRRGAVFEAHAPAGPIELAVPATLLR